MMESSLWLFHQGEEGAVLGYKMPSKLKENDYYAMFDMDDTLIYYNKDILCISSFSFFHRHMTF